MDATASTTDFIATPIGDVPATMECPICHRPLKVTSMTVMGKTYENLPCWGSCGCKSSAEKYDGIGKRSSKTSFDDKVREAGIGREYAKSELPCEEYVGAVKDGRNVFIVGGNGTLKSMLAASIAKRLIQDGKQVLFVNPAVEGESMKRSFAKGADDRWELMCSVPVLVLDDVGKANPTEWTTSMLYTVVEARNADGLPTVTTSNYAGGDLVDRLTIGNDPSAAKAIVSRLRGGAAVVRMDGPDRRVS